MHHSGARAAELHTGQPRTRRIPADLHRASLMSEDTELICSMVYTYRHDSKYNGMGWWGKEERQRPATLIMDCMKARL